MADEMVKYVQIWLMEVYTPALIGTVEPDGITGNSTIKALTKALQIELAVAPVDGIFGNSTSEKLVNLSDTTPENTYNNLDRVIYILQGSLYCKGYNPSGFDGVYGNGVKTAIKNFKNDAGLKTLDGVTEPKIFKAILNTDGYILDSNGDSNIRIIQQSLNQTYYEYMDLIPTNGIKDRKMSKALIIGLQAEEHKTVTTVTVDGIWGPNTLNNCPTLKRYGAVTNKQFVYLLQYALYFNNFNPNGFDGGFSAGVELAIKNFQTFVGLSSDGVGGKQTWASLMISYGDKMRIGKVCDTTHVFTTQADIDTIKGEGKETVGRYISGTTKKLVKAELTLLLNAGLRVFPIYQEYNNDISRFSKEIGIEHASNALKNAINFGFLQGTIIYFPVDFDATEGQTNDEVTEFFKSIYSVFSDSRKNPMKYKIGIYGARRVCQNISDKNLAVKSFVCDMSSGFVGNIGYSLPTNWNYDQIREYAVTTTEGNSFFIDNIVTRPGADMGESQVNQDLINTLDLITIDFSVLNEEDYCLIVAISRMFLTYIKEANYVVADVLYSEMCAIRRKNDYQNKYPANYRDAQGFFKLEYSYQSTLEERSHYAVSIMDNIRYSRSDIVKMKQEIEIAIILLNFIPKWGSVASVIIGLLNELEQSEDGHSASLDYIEGVSADYFVDRVVNELEGTIIYTRCGKVLDAIASIYDVVNIASIWGEEDTYYYVLNSGNKEERFRITTGDFYVRINILFDNSITLHSIVTENIIYAHNDQPMIYWRNDTII